MNFPGKDFQKALLGQLGRDLKQLRWLISEDAHVTARSCFDDPASKTLNFGVFDDTFDYAWEPGSYNREGWEFFGMGRSSKAPAGGEIYFGANENGRAQAVNANWAAQAKLFGISFLLGETWLSMSATKDNVREYGLATGYRFRVTQLEGNATELRGKVKNVGVAPIYYDAFVAVNRDRSRHSLKGLLPGQESAFRIGGLGAKRNLSIECDRLVPGQRIEFEADLEGGEKGKAGAKR